ncbi:MAG: nucleotide exchange factor GrpE [Phenylobacterium sp.]|uniref:nucleotide exchange factor GrpE n=1 Tax=Phenylobacterium sp. TaxID=1871053 RepID=UPI001B436EEB|nr:nucleotide exchange factor GrpE [Phenylobacterium sp.]MBP7651092.1 nucleotide exchange factor GrpE [Phenylobacterium sp.]MBP7817653.1 nucleotide exchange factor GrpE [Phenylobacterium sp.]
MSDDQTPADAVNDIADAAIDHIEALTTENKALKEQVLRYAAEAENTRRRAEREANDARAYAIQKFGKDLLAAADNLSRALAAAPADSPDTVVKTFVVGVEMTAKSLQTAFETNGLKKIEPEKGVKFDPHQHQAMMEQPSTEVGAGGVIQVLQPGYELLGRLIRPAMVVVAAKGSTGPSASAAEPTGGPANPYAANDASHDTSHDGDAVDTKA